VRSLTDSWELGGLTVPNRVVLAPLAGIGNWFVRLQAKRHGAGLCVSEMVSSFAVHHRNERTLRELLRVHPDERAGGPTAIQLFGHDPEVMRSAAEAVARTTDVDLIDLNMGCPVPKVCKTGAGAALLRDPGRAAELALAAREGSGLPVTVKLRTSRTHEDRDGVEVARRLVSAGVAGLTLHPRSATQRHTGEPDYALVRALVEELPVPVIVSGGLQDADSARRAWEESGAAAIMLARGSLGNPWLFEQLLGDREEEPTRDEVLAELHWIMDRAVEHLGEPRAARYLRKFYPWYLDRLDAGPAVRDALQRAETTAEVREAILPRPLCPRT
jgi:nifR3 family TIM-barrel protein